jgi:hypothetical protein
MADSSTDYAKNMSKKTKDLTGTLGGKKKKKKKKGYAGQGRGSKGYKDYKKGLDEATGW